MDLISTLRYAAKRKKEEEAKKGKASGGFDGEDVASEGDEAPLEDDDHSGPDEGTSGSEP
jgi:hypothetical protein